MALMEEPRSTPCSHGHRARPLAGGLSLLLLIAIAAATPAAGFEPLLCELAGHGGNDRSALRAWSGRIVEAVRSARRVVTRSNAVRPVRAWDASLAARHARPTAAVAAGRGPTLLLRVERHNLPPPARA